MPNRYANLTPSKKISEDFPKITEGFDKVQEEMDAKPDAGFAQINDIEAEGSDELTVEGGTGITVTTVPEEKKLRITATSDATPGLHGIEHNHDGADPIPELVQVRADLTSHKVEDVTDPGGVHGLAISNGTWTPILKGLTVEGVNSYSVQLGWYYKVGKLVFVQGQIVVSAKDPAMAGDIVIGGLPYFVPSVVGRSVPGQCRPSSGITIGVDEQLVPTCFLMQNTTHLYPFLMYNKTTKITRNPNATDIEDGFGVAFSGVYETIS